MSNKAEHLEKGRQAEDLAANAVTKAGLKIIQRNFQSRFGEIDLICRQGKELIFVEVRYRSHTGYGSAASSVTVAKQKKISKAAQYFILNNPALSSLYMRFDVIGIDAENSIEWIKGAFQAAL
jgi:putative endonuclease